MSINDLSDTIYSLARRSVLESKAVYPCLAHPDVLLTAGDSELEKKAYAIATNHLKREFGDLDWRDSILEAVKEELNIADYECAHCESNLRE